MDELRDFINSLPVPEQIAFARACGTSVGYLRKAISNRELLREKLCAAIERQSFGLVSRRALRPGDWGDIWPELICAEHPWPQAGASAPGESAGAPTICAA